MEQIPKEKSKVDVAIKKQPPKPRYPDYPDKPYRKYVWHGGASGDVERVK